MAGTSDQMRTQCGGGCSYSGCSNQCFLDAGHESPIPPGKYAHLCLNHN
jgi:hypothetical protein